jgi:Tfp pilus assembly protein PilN
LVIRASIGLSLENGRLTVVALGGGDRLAHFVVEGVEDPAGALDAELRARKLPARRIHVGLDRRSVVVKTLELPRASGGDLGRMVGFELERHVPFPPEETRFGWIELPSSTDESRRLLAAAAGRRAVERPLGLLAGAKRRPASITVACHELPALLPRALPARRTVWAHRHGNSTDLLLLIGRTLLMSRSVDVADTEGLAREIQRSLPLVDWSRCETVWISGDDAAAWVSDPELAGVLDAPVSTPPYDPRRGALVAALPEETCGATLLALGVALGSRRPALDLLPAQMRPWTLSRAQLVTAGIACATVLLGLTLAITQVNKSERYLGRLTEEIRRLDPEAKAVDAEAAERDRHRRVLAGLDAVQRGNLPGLPILRDLTEALPETAWLQALSMDREGVELVGQADAASQLIPVLEASRWLERVEFTSPVTKLQGKEQFRIRAAWEAPQAAPPGPVR